MTLHIMKFVQRLTTSTVSVYLKKQMNSDTNTDHEKSKGVKKGSGQLLYSRILGFPQGMTRPVLWCTCQKAWR